MLSWLISQFFSSVEEENNGSLAAQEINVLRDALDLLKPLTDGRVLTVSRTNRLIL